MVSEPVTIRSMVKRAQVGGYALYRIIDSSGQKYATTNMWTASQCQSAFDTQQRVVLVSSSGWHYRDLIDVRPVAEAVTGSPLTQRGAADNKRDVVSGEGVTVGPERRRTRDTVSHE